MTRRLAAAVAVVLLVAGCGGSDHSAQKDVSKYIDDVNSVQHGLSLPLGQVALGYRQLAKGSNLPAMQPKLAKSARTIHELARRVDALDPPPEAIRLDAVIRRLVHGEAQLADELALLAAYVHDAAPAAVTCRAGEGTRGVCGAARHCGETAGEAPSPAGRRSVPAHADRDVPPDRDPRACACDSAAGPEERRSGGARPATGGGDQL